MARSKYIVEVKKKHASSNTKYHAIYGYKNLNLSRRDLSRIYGKDYSTVSRWITEYDQTGQFGKARLHAPNKVLNEEHVEWIKQLYENEPTMYLKETRNRFHEQFGFTVHHSTLSRTLRKIGFTRKVLERRALQIKSSEILFFCKELESFHWDLPNLVFIDEVSFNNTEMFRTYGYGQVGERILVHGRFQRVPRISLLCFLGLDGLLETSITPGLYMQRIVFYSVANIYQRFSGTFTRKAFFEACRRFALGGKVRQYPGVNSVWILDGARIHTDANIVRYFRSLGILMIFLPSYCPFMNPIEILFGIIKQSFKKDFDKNEKNLQVFVSEKMSVFQNFSAKKIFRKCGYYPGGKCIPEGV